MGLFNIFAKKSPAEGYRHLALMTLCQVIREDLYKSFKDDSDLIEVEDQIYSEWDYAIEMIDFFIKTGNHSEDPDSIYLETQGILANVFSENFPKQMTLRDLDDALFNVYSQAKEHTLKSAAKNEIYLQSTQVNDLAKKFDTKLKFLASKFYGIL